MVNKNSSWKWLSSILQHSWYWLWGWPSPWKCIVVYPPLEQADKIKANPGLFDPTEWPREPNDYDWYHQAVVVSDTINAQAGQIITIVCEANLDAMREAERREAYEKSYREAMDDYWENFPWQYCQNDTLKITVIDEKTDKGAIGHFKLLKDTLNGTIVVDDKPIQTFHTYKQGIAELGESVLDKKVVSIVLDDKTDEMLFTWDEKPENCRYIVNYEFVRPIRPEGDEKYMLFYYMNKEQYGTN